MKKVFGAFARKVALASGTATAFLLALLCIVVWAVLGPAAGYSEAWQLTVNTGTTIITFLMVFLVQHSQNHDSKALHLKLDELLHALNEARDDLMELEDKDEDALKKVREDHEQLGQTIRRRRDTREG